MKSHYGTVTLPIPETDQCAVCQGSTIYFKEGKKCPGSHSVKEINRALFKYDAQGSPPNQPPRTPSLITVDPQTNREHLIQSFLQAFQSLGIEVYYREHWTPTGEISYLSFYIYDDQRLGDNLPDHLSDLKKLSELNGGTLTIPSLQEPFATTSTKNSWRFWEK